AGAGRQWHVDGVTDRAFVRRTGARIQRRLVGRQVHHPGIEVEDVGGAVTVVDVEVDDRDALQPVPVARVRRGERDVVEQAEPHRDRTGGVVSGRTHGAERPRYLPGQYRVGCGDAGAGGPQRGLGGAGSEQGI